MNRSKNFTFCNGGVKPRGCETARQHCVRMPEDMHQAVVERARRHNCSINEVVRTYIEWGLETENDHAI